MFEGRNPIADNASQEAGYRRTVIVTGAGTGIGRSIAQQLLAQEENVAVVGRREAPLRELADHSPDHVEVVTADLAEPAAAQQIVAATVNRFGAVHGLVNNAGLARFSPLDQASEQDLEDLWAINIRAPGLLIRAALPYLQATSGAVVNVSSVGGVLAMPGRSMYGATKAARNSLTRSLAQELAPAVRVNAVLPGPVQTPMWKDMGLGEEDSASLRTALLEATPLRRFGETEDVARWVTALLDPAFAGWVTGALIPVDGGRTS